MITGSTTSSMASSTTSRAILITSPATLISAKQIPRSPMILLNLWHRTFKRPATLSRRCHISAHSAQKLTRSPTSSLAATIVRGGYSIRPVILIHRHFNLLTIPGGIASWVRTEASTQSVWVRHPTTGFHMSGRKELTMCSY